jgi:Zn-dependent M28 family amino/carboxypeptidase
VILFNEGQSGRRDIVQGTLGEDDSLTIPVLGTTFALGAALVEAGEPVVTMSVFTSREEIETHNVLAETSTGDTEQVVVVGAHLDSVGSGAGINDNGSGSAAVLELAEELARTNTALTNRIRFAFWGAEELGLLGSTAYVASLSLSEREDILANLNFDMIASPNFVRFVYDGDGSDTPEAGPAGSDTIEQLFLDWFEGQGLDTEPTAFSGRSDYGPFIAVGIPAGGLFSGAEGQKSNLEAEMYGGTPDEPYDSCYHQECDDRSNVSEQCLGEMSEAAFAVTLQLAQDPAPFTTRSARQHDLRERMHAFPRRGTHFQR